MSDIQTRHEKALEGNVATYSFLSSTIVQHQKTPKFGSNHWKVLTMLVPIITILTCQSLLISAQTLTDMNQALHTELNVEKCLEVTQNGKPLNVPYGAYIYGYPYEKNADCLQTVSCGSNSQYRTAGSRLFPDGKWDLCKTSVNHLQTLTHSWTRVDWY